MRSDAGMDKQTEGRRLARSTLAWLIKQMLVCFLLYIFSCTVLTEMGARNL